MRADRPFTFRYPPTYCIAANRWVVTHPDGGNVISIRLVGSHEREIGGKLSSRCQDGSRPDGTYNYRVRVLAWPSASRAGSGVGLSTKSTGLPLRTRLAKSS